VKACLEVGEGGTGAFIPELPGCWVFARNEERALAKAKSAASNWYAWAKRHGEPVAPPTKIKVEPSEVLRVSYNPVEAGKPEPLFWSEVLPVTRQDIGRTLRLMNHSRRDLLELCRNLDNSRLRRKPNGGPRTIGKCLRHIASVEWWYITRLDIDLPTDFPRDLFDLLQYTRDLAERELKRLTKEQRTRIFQPHSDPSPVCNLWTARKVLRRFVDHERLHAAYIRRALVMRAASS
jgi:uncharacterized damage-inducible protein DinB/predicted RNase H-like HicB family nuclease